MSNMTGSNAVLVHSARVYAAVLDKNASLAADAFTRIWGELYFSDGRKAGIKADGAFFQHCDPYGPGYLPLGKIGQLYSGGYGSDFSKAMLQWVGSVAGIKTFPLSEDNYQVVSALVLDGQVTLVTSSVARNIPSAHKSIAFQEWMAVGNKVNWDVSVIGREVSRPGHAINWPESAFRNLPPAMPRFQEYEAFSRRLFQDSNMSTLGNKQFWTADYMVHRRANYTATLKMTSSRMLNTECIAFENQHGRYLGAGT